MGKTTPSTVSRDARDARTSIANDEDDEKTSTIGVVTTRYEAFHARVDAVFAEVGRRPSTKTSRGDVEGFARAGRGASNEAWRPRDEAVVRTGTGTGTASDGDDDDDDDDYGTGRRAIDDDIDCLESDEDEDDDARRMRRLRASVGRCRALEREDDFDAADAAAMGDDARAVMRGAFERTGGESSSRAVPHHLAHPEKYTRYDFDDAPTVGVPATEPELAGEEPSRNARDERPNTPNARAETSSRDATPRPRFSREAAAKARRPKRRREEDASRARVAFHENDDEDETREGGDDANDTMPFDARSRRPRRFRRK